MQKIIERIKWFFFVTFTSKGELNKSEYWQYFWLTMFVYIGGSFLMTPFMLNTGKPNPFATMFMMILGIIIVLCFARLIVKRSRALNLSPYYGFLAIVPLINIVFCIYFGTLNDKKPEDIEVENLGVTKKYDSLFKRDKKFALAVILLLVVGVIFSYNTWFSSHAKASNAVESHLSGKLRRTEYQIIGVKTNSDNDYEVAVKFKTGGTGYFTVSGSSYEIVKIVH